MSLGLICNATRVIDVIEHLLRGMLMAENIYQKRINEWEEQNGQLSILCQRKLNNLIAQYKKTQSINIEEKSVKLLVSASLVILSCLLTAIGVYDRIAKYCGAGTLVPITGFANAMMSPVMDYKSEGVITGAAAKMFIIAGPVIVYGVIASMIYGLIYYISTLNII